MGTQPDNDEAQRQPPPKPYMPTYAAGADDFEDEAELDEAGEAVEELEQRRASPEGRERDRGRAEGEEDQ
jgi:hypothetical protein